MALRALLDPKESAQIPALIRGHLPEEQKEAPAHQVAIPHNIPSTKTKKTQERYRVGISVTAQFKAN